MTKEDKVKHWVKLSDENLRVAKDLLKSKHLLQTGFFCHLTIETIFKAYFTQIKDELPPYIHKLARLAQQADFFDDMSDAHKDFIYKLDPFNIEARYPEYKNMLAKSLNFQICENLLQQTQELQLWTKEKILLAK
jgi:HEPN domain-containing protein